MKSINQILWFPDIDCQNPVLAGNKGAGLAKLVAAGYNVPPGFCIISEVLSPFKLNKKQLSESLKRLSAPWIARSSSTAEDSSSLSFAGVFTTVLGLTTSEEVYNAAKIIVSSKDENTTKRYATEHNIKTSEIRMAVVIQSLLQPFCSGVAFSRHPITKENKVIIESNYGLGDILVDGSVIPDLLEVSSDGKVDIIKIGTKKKKSIFNGTVLQRVEVPETERLNLSISHETARNLAEVVHKVEQDLGKPQDIEWAVVNEQIYITQARPITTLN